MAKTVTEKPAKVAKPKKFLISAVAESSKKADPERMTTRAAGKRKSMEADGAVKDAKKAKVAVEEPKKSAAAGKKAAAPKAEGKANAKGKKKVEVVEEAEEPKAAAPSKTKDVKSKKTAASKAKAKSPSPPPEESDAEEQAGSDAEDAQEEEDVQLFGFSTDDDDDSSDEEMDVNPNPVDVGKLPTIAKDDAIVKQKLEKAKRKPTENRGVLYLGRIPHGFYEEQMKSYFSQFGDVTRIRLSRNKRTGQSKHYGFIEFESSSVAQIVAETMDNYLLMGHILTCKVIPKDEVHPELWLGANRKWRAVPRGRVSRVLHNRPRTEDEQQKAEKRLLKRQAQKKRKLEEAGIKYDFDAVAYKKKAQASS
ncbi:RNA-binding domain-containing protein [Phanerochaete sordida]|uniref:RNA-binding domain-containing protein n=1 Tax=Phanerochaete sordida TaxID=48140 RepID=A0A9P3GR10_9APHY|nr:RNA-binding domain-containing protein [Phanerochaete sordida]